MNDNQGTYTCEVNVDGKTEQSSAKVYIEAKSYNDFEDLHSFSGEDVDETVDEDAMSDTTLVNDNLRSVSSDEEQPRPTLDPSFSELLEESSYNQFCDDRDNLRHHILTPILEENEDAQSVMSSTFPHQEFESPSEANFSHLHRAPLQSASYDSLASFEANEKLMMMLEGSPRKDIKNNKNDKVNTSGHKHADTEEQDILNYALRRQKNRITNSPFGSPVSSHTFYITKPSNCLEDPNLSSDSVADKTESQHTKIDEENEEELKNEKKLPPQKITNDELPHQPKAERSLSLHSLERNFPSEKRESICASYSTDNDALDAFEDRVIGYLAQRQREDSIFDLSSLHKTFSTSDIEIPGSIVEQQSMENNVESSVTNDVTSNDKSENFLQRDDSSSEDCSSDESGDEKASSRSNNESLISEQFSAEKCQPENFKDSSTSNASLDLQSDCNPTTLSDSPNESMQALCIFNDSAFETVSSCESDFHSCTSSMSTNIPYETPQRAVFETEYQTPPESQDNYETPVETDSDDSGTAVLSSTKSILSPLTTTVTSGAAGYQTPPKWYYVIPPKFIGNKTDEVSVARGGTAILECSIVSHPEAKVAWYKDGRLLEIYDRISQHTSNQPPVQLAREYVESSSWKAPPLLPTETDIDIGCVPQLDVHYLLKIKNAMLKDEGSYVCKAWNSAGVATRVISLIVSGRTGQR